MLNFVFSPRFIRLASKFTASHYWNFEFYMPYPFLVLSTLRCILPTPTLPVNVRLHAWNVQKKNSAQGALNPIANRATGRIWQGASLDSIACNTSVWNWGNINADGGTVTGKGEGRGSIETHLRSYKLSGNPGTLSHRFLRGYNSVSVQYMELSRTSLSTLKSLFNRVPNCILLILAAPRNAHYREGNYLVNWWKFI